MEDPGWWWWGHITFPGSLASVAQSGGGLSQALSPLFIGMIASMDNSIGTGEMA